VLSRVSPALAKPFGVSTDVNRNQGKKGGFMAPSFVIMDISVVVTEGFSLWVKNAMKVAVTHRK